MISDRTATLVVDLGFGDCGKGTVTDVLARRGARWVVRFNGGAQAGHNVVTSDGRHHTFSQFGSGTFVPGVCTFLSRFMVVHPTALLVEADHLARLGVTDAMARLQISREAIVITPYHQAANRVRERLRATGAHGTCGVGVGETVSDALTRPELAIRMGELLEPRVLKAKLASVREAKGEEVRTLLRSNADVPEAIRDAQLFEDSTVIDGWLEATRPLGVPGLIVGDAHLGQVLQQEGDVVFEGAQGVLLDEWRGFHPHTTWSTCTFANAQTLLREHSFEGRVLRLGVTRSYLTRHGAGPFPTEDPGLANVMPEPHNSAKGWQGSFRVGWLDALALRYAVACCGGIDGLAVTHLDRVPLDGAWLLGDGYYFDRPADHDLFEFSAVEPERARGIRLGRFKDLAHQERLSGALRTAKPLFRSLPAGPGRTAQLCEELQAIVSAPVRLTSSGPDADSKAWVRDAHEPDDAELPPLADAALNPEHTQSPVAA